MKEGKLYYATLNLHSERKGILEEIRFSPEIERYIVRKSLYKKHGDPVNIFANAANALGVVFFHFPDMETMLYMEEHMNEHVKILLQGEHQGEIGGYL